MAITPLNEGGGWDKKDEVATVKAKFFTLSIMVLT
jgi:hypothetical protein